MITWNYRVVRHHERGKTLFGLHEVHYDQGKPILFNERPIAIGESLMDLHETLSLMGRATAHALLMTEGFEPIPAEDFEENRKCEH